MIGPALAGLVIGLGGYELAFALNTLSFFAVFAVVASFRLPPPVSALGMSILDSIREGARFVRGDAALRFVVGCMALNSLLAAPFIALIPAVALDVFHEEKLGTAALVTAQGVGAVCMALALATFFARFGTAHASCSACCSRCRSRSCSTRSRRRCRSRWSRSSSSAASTWARCRASRPSRSSARPPSCAAGS